MSPGELRARRRRCSRTRCRAAARRRPCRYQCAGLRLARVDRHRVLVGPRAAEPRGARVEVRGVGAHPPVLGAHPRLLGGGRRLREAIERGVGGPREVDQARAVARRGGAQGGVGAAQQAERAEEADHDATRDVHIPVIDSDRTVLTSVARSASDDAHLGVEVYAGSNGRRVLRISTHAWPAKRRDTVTRAWLSTPTRPSSSPAHPRAATAAPRKSRSRSAATSTRSAARAG